MNFLSWQLNNFFDLDNLLTALLGLFVIYVVFYFIYFHKNLEYITLKNGKFSIFDKEYLDKFLNYTYWALFQQCLVLVPPYFINVSPILLYIPSVIVFSCLFHVKNWRLMAFTASFGTIFYALWFFLDFQSFIYLALLHAFGGTAYYYTGWSMEVWRFIDFGKIKKWFSSIF